MSTQTRMLFALLQDNYKCLQRQYRLGEFERPVHFIDSNESGSPETVSVPKFVVVDLDNPPQTGEALTRVSFKEAIDHLHQLSDRLKFAEKLPGDDVLLLRCQCLIYEAKDYRLAMSLPENQELARDLVQIARSFPRSLVEIVDQAKRFYGKEFENNTECGQVIKLRLIAALCGVNHLYRQHNRDSYTQALSILENLDIFIRTDLRDQHEQPRDSFGLIGLCKYITGRVHSAMGSFERARESFHQSAEAYMNRIRQKEELRKDEKRADDKYNEKISVTLRRTALVTAFGDGYIAFVTSQITRALECFTLARAALSQNSGRAYLVYVDCLYWACQRARWSSDSEKIEQVLIGLGKCYREFEKLIKEQLLEDSLYLHRTGVQLALAHFYRRKLNLDPADVDFEKGISYLEEAIKYASDSITKNVPLICEAKTIKARFLRSKFHQYRVHEADRAFKILLEAKSEAEDACNIGRGLKVIEAEAQVVLGDILSDFAAWPNRNDQNGFSAERSYFGRAMAAFKRALNLSLNENRRVEALCYLRLTRLCLLDQGFQLQAMDYFAEWKKIEEFVEHAYCKQMALKLADAWSEPFFIVRPLKERQMSVGWWQNRLESFLIDLGIQQFVSNEWRKSDGPPSFESVDSMKKALVAELYASLELDPRTIEKRVSPRVLGEVALMLENPGPAIRQRLTSYTSNYLNEMLDDFVGSLSHSNYESGGRLSKELERFLADKTGHRIEKVRDLIDENDLQNKLPLLIAKRRAELGD